MFNTKGWFNGITKGHSPIVHVLHSWPCTHHPVLHPHASIPRQRVFIGIYQCWSSMWGRRFNTMTLMETNHSSLSNGSLLQEGKLFSWFLLKNILYIYMYICVCMYGHMYVYAHVHVYMYISISNINIAYVRVVNTPWSYFCLPHAIISSVLC